MAAVSSQSSVMAFVDQVVAAEKLPDEAGELLYWWFQTSLNDALKTIPKAVEYGSADMIEMGHELMDIAHRKVDDDEAAEIGTWFYLLGKVKRWHNAIKREERVSEDTLLDISVYSMMARRIRDVGGWPGVVL